MKLRLSLLLLALCLTVTAYGQTAPARMVVNADLGETTISRFIYGHFAEHLGRDIYDGFWIKTQSNPEWHYNDKVIEALKKIKVPILRWPGGCFADYYHWRDGIGPRDQRPTMVNTIWGNVTEDNSFGTHEFMELVDRLDAEPFIVGNVGTGTPREMVEWWEYLNFPGRSPAADERRKNGREEPWNVKYWGVGNESWGCGGNMTAEYYANQYRQYAEFIRSYGPGQEPFRIATGPNVDMYNWTEVMMRDAGHRIDALDLHYYTTEGARWEDKGKATQFNEEGWFNTLKNALRMEELVQKHATIMDKYDPQKRVALMVGEWGTWHQVEPGTNPGFLYQQNSLRDALVASVTLDIFNRHADRVRMAMIAQTINVLQAMILTQGEQMILTPTYHVFDFYTVHHDATLLPMSLEAGTYELNGRSIPAISATASRNKEGKVHITLTNLDPNNKRTVTADVRGIAARKVSGRVLTATAMTAHNTFEAPEVVKPANFNGAKLQQNTLTVEMPSKSVVVLELE